MGLTPIARFDVVPYQRFSADTKIGVVAFSKDGIQDVEFTINSGEVDEASVTVTEMTLNSRTGVWEYWTTLDVSEFTDGVLTIDATVTGAGYGASLLRDYVLSAATGTYGITGSDATLTYTTVGSTTLDAETGQYGIIGSTTGLLHGHVMAVATGVYAVTGSTTDLLLGQSMVVATGQYTITGSDTDLLVDYVLAALAGSYTYTGATATLTYSGAEATGNWIGFVSQEVFTPGINTVEVFMPGFKTTGVRP